MSSPKTSDSEELEVEEDLSLPYSDIFDSEPLKEIEDDENIKFFKEKKEELNVLEDLDIPSQEPTDELFYKKKSSQFYIPIVIEKNTDQNSVYWMLKKNITELGPYTTIEEGKKEFKNKLNIEKGLYIKTSTGWYKITKRKGKNEKIEKIEIPENALFVFNSEKKSRIFENTKSRAAAPAAGGKTKRRRQNKTVRFSIFSFPFACSKEDFRKTKKSQRKNRKTRRK
jgi:hypothetical protein